MKVLVLITTHKRPEWCLQLLKDLKEQSDGIEVKVGVFHDKDESDYSEVIAYCRANKWEYLRSKIYFGKWDHWKLYNLIYTYAEMQDYDMFIQLPDDVDLVDNFIMYANNLLSECKAVNILTLNQHIKTFKLKDYIGAVRCNWLDGCFVSKKKYMDGIRLNEPVNSIQKDDKKGSGSGSELSKAFIENNGSGSIFMSNYALVYHKGFDGQTVMHNTDVWAHTNQDYYQSRIYKSLTMSELLNGKSVAFVGMASNIKGKGLGKEIDAHDVVYRTNMFPIPKELQNDYGTRCDILGLQDAYAVNLEQYYNDGIRNIVHYGTKSFKNVRKFNVKVATPEYRKQISDHINAAIAQKIEMPTAGLVALYLCKQSKCKSFKYYGITGYQNLNHEVQNHQGENNYTNQYLEFWGDRKDRLIKTDMLANKYHNFQAHNEYLTKILKLGIIDMDEFSKPYFL